MPSPAEAKKAEAREAKTDKHDAEDLEAQIRAADAAEEQMLPAWAAVAVSLIALGLLGWTVFETNRTAAAAIRSANLTEQSMRATQRAHMAVVRFNPGAHCRHPTTNEVTGVLCEIIWKNLGPTPALNVTMMIGYEAVANIGDATYQCDIPDRRDPGGIGPGIERFTSWVMIPIEDIRECWKGTKELLVYSVVEYDDVFRAELNTPRRVSKVCGSMRLPGPPELIGSNQPYVSSFKMVGPFNEST